MKPSSEPILSKVDSAVNGESDNRRWSKAGNSGWRQLTQGIPTGSLVVRARDSLLAGSPSGAFLALLAAKQELVESYICDYVLLREKLVASREEARRIAEDFYADTMARALRDKLRQWRPGQQRFHRALLTWVTEAFQHHQRRKAVAAIECWQRARGRALLCRAMDHLKAYQHAHPGNADHVLMSLVAQHPDETWEERLVRLSQLGYPIQPGALRTRYSRARARLKHFLRQALNEAAAVEGESYDADEFLEELAAMGLGHYTTNTAAPVEKCVPRP